ncbi:hypothetical protein B0H67DRAFT_108231 [Lasiosphaeris hirsuta]|uniref:Tetratricopeptide repeat protein n=1 Tax=Lasiosphaeris hirsuta TaxID=260670 RepID=A0AA40E4B3_9PEZI|nr:hypothetical protein B0H67DRAFT_108231 [Lasiosphaeris hirsuta]
MRNHYYTCVSFYHTADVADMVGDHDTAVKLLEESVKAFELIPEARNYVARSFFRLSGIHATNGRQADADANLKKAQGILRETGVERPGTSIQDYEASMPIRFR